MKHIQTILLPIMAILLTTACADAASITGKVVYEGVVPNLKPISMDADPICSAKHDAPVLPDVLVLGEGNSMANILVYVSDVSGDFPTPEKEVVLDQEGCRYEPHVIGIQVGQKLKILNPDGTLHNIHALPKLNAEFNMAMPKFKKQIVRSFDKAESVFPIKCDVHPWMSAWIAVFDHPFFAVTQKDGVFTIDGLSAGTHEIVAWHEKLGEQNFSVTIGADETKTLDITFKKP